MRLAAASFRLLLVPAALLAAACDDRPELVGPQEPPTADDGGAGRAAVRQDGEGGLEVAGSPHWADGYLLSDLTNASSYTPSPSYSFNRAARLGGAITIAQPTGTTGRYIATFPNLSGLLGGRSTLHVSVYYGSYVPRYCKPAGAALATDKIEVRCFEARTGAPAPAQFGLLVTRNYADLAFAYAHQPTGTNYSPAASASWNPAGTSTVVRSGTGQYRVTFNGLGAQLPPDVLGHVQVQAVGTGNAYCNPMNWYTSGSNLSVDVRCYTTPTGALVDQKFNVFFALPSDHLAYAFADQPLVASYSPKPYFSSNPYRTPITITRRGVGLYKVEWPGMNNELLGYGNIQVSAYGGNTLCLVESRSVTAAFISCTAANGAAAESKFTALLGS
jgi:hypothetical protein